jgi:hypothetical protein
MHKYFFFLDKGILFLPLQEFCTQPFIITSFQPPADEEKLSKVWETV